MLDPSSIYTIHTLEDRIIGHAAQDEQDTAARGTGTPSAGPILVNAIRGFIDAGSAGELSAGHLLEQFPSKRLVDFDADQLLTYRSRRPTMTFDGDQWSNYEDPELVIDLLHDAEGTAFLLMHGLEPDLQWERFVAGVSNIIADFDVSLVVGLHGVPMGVPHTRPMTSTGHSTRPELLLPQPQVFGKVQVPASVSALLEYRLGNSGRDALGFAIHVPHYLAQGEYAPAALEAITQVERVTGLALESAKLEEAAREATEEINRQVAGSEEVRTVVEALEEQYDKFMRTVGKTLLAESAFLPTADELGAQFEEFLAQVDSEGVDEEEGTDAGADPDDQDPASGPQTEQS